MIKILNRVVISFFLSASLLGCVQPVQAPPATSNAAASSSDAAYQPQIAPADFVAVIDNPFLPLIPGTTFVYEGMTADGLERVEIKILTETRQVMGIQATIMQDTVTIGGEVVEDTFDWFAQDKAGNVWYLGEDVDNYEGGVVKDHAGSWEAGVDGALPGIVMFADPAAHVGETYYQEFYAGEAEDEATLLSASESISVAYGTFENVVQTYDFTALDPDSQEHKFYAAGIGSVKTVNLTTGVIFDLIEFTPVATTTVELLPQPTSGFPPGFEPNEADRVDIAKPIFSNPTSITNPLLPITEVDQLIQLGLKDGYPHRTEFTLLPGTKTISWNGEQTEVRILQFVAYLDGRVLEHALDFLAQADGGAVWYFGEDVYNYENGVVIDRDGTWLAGKDGPAAMIMPANPKVGDVFRPENIPGNVFEEVEVKSVDAKVEGPFGPVNGAIITEELHMDGKYEDKIFAPKYGEFSTGSGRDLEVLAIAIPADALAKSVPAELTTLSDGTKEIFNSAESGNWTNVSNTLKNMNEAWTTFQIQKKDNMSKLLQTQMSKTLDALAGDVLSPAVDSRDVTGTQYAVIDAGLAILDLKLPYLLSSEIDLERFELWSIKLLVDAESGNMEGFTGDVTTLEWIQDRFLHGIDSSLATKIDSQIKELRSTVDDEDSDKSIDTVKQLLDSINQAQQ